MRIKHFQIFDPIHHPSGLSYPPRIEMAVAGLGEIRDPAPDAGWPLGTWALSWHADALLLFTHPAEGLCTRERTDEFGLVEKIPHEGLLNVSGVLTEPVFPVTVSPVDADGMASVWRDMWAPVSLVRELLADHQPRPELGEWVLRPSDHWASRCQIVFELHFEPARAADHAGDARSRAARKPR